MERHLLTTLIVTMFAASGAFAAGERGASLYVDSAKGSDEADGSQAKPLKTLAKALSLAKGGETIWLADGQYPAVAIGKKYAREVVVRAVNKLGAMMVGGVVIAQAENVRLQDLRFAWTPATRPKQDKDPFIGITNSKHVEVVGCEIADDPKRDVYAGFSIPVSNSDHVTIRDCRIHHVYMGPTFSRSTNCTASGLTIGPWSHEDGIRVMECEGPTLIENCHISNEGNQGRRTGHVDALQVVYWSDNLTIRNCVIHNASQAIGAFRCKDRRRKNWRIEGNLIYDVYTPHYCTVVETDGIIVVNNTFPQGPVNLSNCTGGVVKNNIFGDGTLRSECIKEADHNLWIQASGGSGSRKQKFGPHDLAGVEAKFVNAPKFFGKCDYWGKGAKESFTDRKVVVGGSIDGKIAVGDQVELLIADGRPRDGVLRKVVKVEGRMIEVDKPTDVTMKGKMVLIYNWGREATSAKLDYHLRPGSPAIDSADGGVDRVKDMDGHAAFDHADTPNTGAGKIKHLDRGAFEYVPPRE